MFSSASRPVVSPVNRHGSMTTANLPMPLNAYASRPITLTSAKTTTLKWARVPPRSLPKRVWIHCAPVITPERRVHALMNIMRKIWLNVGHIHGSQMLFAPYKNSA